MTTVYKVVRRTRRGYLWSCNLRCNNELVRRYDPGKLVLPANRTKLLAFNSLQYAQGFSHWMLDSEVWEAKADSPQLQESLSWSVFAPDLEAFWHGDHEAEMDAPFGTVACDSITLIKRVGGHHDA